MVEGYGVREGGADVDVGDAVGAAGLGRGGCGGAYGAYGASLLVRGYLQDLLQWQSARDAFAIGEGNRSASSGGFVWGCGRCLAPCRYFGATCYSISMTGHRGDRRLDRWTDQHEPAFVVLFGTVSARTGLVPLEVASESLISALVAGYIDPFGN